MRSSATVPHRGATHGCPAPDVTLAADLVARLHGARLRVLPALARDAHALVLTEAWKQFGFANVHDFARERLDRSGRWLRNLARLGAAFAQWPELAVAVRGDDGHPPLNRTSACEVSRVATHATVQSWIATARHSTIRGLKELIHSQRASSSGIEAPTIDSSDPTSDPTSEPSLERSSLQSPEQSSEPSSEHSLAHLTIEAPTYVVRAFNDLERVFLAGNAGCTRVDFLDTLSAEFQSTSPPPSDPDEPRQSAPTRSLRSLDSNPTIALMDDDLNAESEVHPPTSESGDKLIGMARWTLERAKQCQDAGFDGDKRTTTHELFGRFVARLDVEREVDDRIAQLLLWLDNRNAWMHLNCATVLQFGEAVLGESGSTIRNRLRLARTLETHTAIRKAYESGKLSQQRVTRLARLTDQHDLSATALARWVDHASSITIKRLDDELRVVNLPGSGHGARPLNDQEWSAGLSFAPGDARKAILRGSLLALASRPPANVFLRLRASADTIISLRRCLRSSRQNLTMRSQSEALGPAEEARQFPSLRLARLWISRKSSLPDWLCLVAILEEFAEEWDNPQRIARRPTDRITSRDGWRCTAPGCTARSLEVHHVVYQSQGGSDDPSNLTSLCPFHHRMGEHGTLASVAGKAPLGLHWRLGVESFATRYACERPLGVPKS